MKQKLNTHTPGPWYVRGCDGNPGYAMGRHIYSPNEGNTGTVALVSGSLANARLIAAAPDLLAALEAVMPWLGKAVFYDLASLPVQTSKEDLSSVLSMAGKAIAKVRGEA